MDWLGIIFPRKCENCGRNGRYICEKCETGLWEEEQICPVCCRNSRYGLRHKYCHQPWSMDGLACLWAYEGMARRLIGKAKYKYYFDTLGELAERTTEELKNRTEMTYLVRYLTSRPKVVPVPLWKGREKQRGFNQAEIIAKMFTKRFETETESKLLVRVKDTGKQVGRNREERLAAMRGAFEINAKYKVPKNVLIVDDVWTTGATMRECARVLKKAGVRQVWGMVLAR